MFCGNHGHDLCAEIAGGRLVVGYSSFHGMGGGGGGGGGS